MVDSADIESLGQDLSDVRRELDRLNVRLEGLMPFLAICGMASAGYAKEDIAEVLRDLYSSAESGSFIREALEPIARLHGWPE